MWAMVRLTSECVLVVRLTHGPVMETQNRDQPQYGQATRVEHVNAYSRSLVNRVVTATTLCRPHSSGPSHTVIEDLKL